MSIEILPNWHPFFVHFTIALISVGTVLYVISCFFAFHSQWRKDMMLVSLWSLCLAGGFTLLTILAGIQAYLTVGHDSSSHLAMTDHRNWAIGTTIFLFITLGIIKLSSDELKSRVLSSIVLISLFFCVLITGYKGSHLVYKYGLGVMSLPSSLGSHEDHHKDSSGHKTSPKTESSNELHNHDGHSH